jgi:hypothetical protein
MSQTKIEWADTIYSGYKVNIIGEILGPMGKILKPMITEDGYPYIFIHRKKKRIHRIVLETFRGNCPTGFESRHLDGNPKNNHLCNLEWATRTENQRDRIGHGTSNIGERSGSAKLKEEDVRFIVSMRGIIPARNLAKNFGISHTPVIKIWNKKSWRYLWESPR